MADLLAQEVPVNYAEGAFTAGLLHGLGKLLIAVGLPGEYATIMGAYKPGKSMWQLEKQILGFGHAQLAAAAMAQWKLPVPIQKADRRPGGASSFSRRSSTPQCLAASGP